MMAVTGWTELYGAVDCPTRSLSEDSPCTRRSEIGHEYFLAHLNREHRAFQHLLPLENIYDRYTVRRHSELDICG